MGYKIIKACKSICDSCGVVGDWEWPLQEAVRSMKARGWWVRATECYCQECAKPFIQVQRERDFQGYQKRLAEKNAASSL